MNFFIILGPPGAGKGTQSELLKKRLGFTHISTGDIIRKEIAKGSKLGLSVKKIVESGNYVDDSTILDCFANHLESLPANQKETILLDGIPRNHIQALELEKRYPGKLQAVLALKANLDNLVNRFEKRWFCQACQRIVSLSNSPSADTVCEHCGEQETLIRRKDDSPDVIRDRFKVYMQQTASLLEFYSNHKILYEFDALKPVEEIYAYLASNVLQKINGMC